MSGSRPAISIDLPAILFVSGYAVEGEVVLDFRALQQDNIQEVHVELRGLAKTEIKHDKSVSKKEIQLVRVDASLWTRGTAYPPPDSDVLRVPFKLQLPPELPPSFQYSAGRKASVMYSLTVVGVRPGTFQSNRRIRRPLAVVQKDDVGANVRQQLVTLATAGAEPQWGTIRKAERIRRGLWGDYATVDVQFSIPKMSPLPLFVPIPFVIKIDTISAPLTRAKADAHPPDKPIFPPPPCAYSMLDFKLREKLLIHARSSTVNPTADVHVFTSGSGSVVVDTDIAENEWRWLEDADDNKQNPDAKGVWVQRTTFHGTFRLSCPPTFVLGKYIKCEYLLSLKVPFPGLGNDVKMTRPVVVGSGINTPIIKDQPGSSAPATAPRVLDLPPWAVPLLRPATSSHTTCRTYWDADDRAWDDHKD
ncbi:hypothetical protein BV20DRAFT_974263 [Pilatotrama ljubarskyi]|nr:hypothetical protein BV20DRAFT_974263 [Pilatotrama ljubarskyi]